MHGKEFVSNELLAALSTTWWTRFVYVARHLVLDKKVSPLALEF